jgi:hypothetical protein
MTERSADLAAPHSDTPERPNVGCWATPPKIGEDLRRQIRDAATDVPWYFISPLVRYWHVGRFDAGHLRLISDPTAVTRVIEMARAHIDGASEEHS